MAKRGGLAVGASASWLAIGIIVVIVWYVVKKKK